jgi:hypothetical protein
MGISILVCPARLRAVSVVNELWIDSDEESSCPFSLLIFFF